MENDGQETTGGTTPDGCLGKIGIARKYPTVQGIHMKQRADFLSQPGSGRYHMGREYQLRKGLSLFVYLSK